MATKKQAGSSGPWIKSDEIYVDTSSAPWMTYAKTELGKKVHELSADDAFIKSMRTSLTLDAKMRALDKQIESFRETSLLLGGKSGPMASGRYQLLKKELPNPAHQVLGQMEAGKLKEKNPEINKYFDGVKTDPAYNKKGRSYDIDPTHESGGYGRITAWCAAFVNWCLSQAGVPHLGYATAKSWLEFGTPVAHPVYGCITIIKPSSSTGSTTGHVAFFVESQGSKVVLLGGNQGDAVSQVGFKEKNVLGYRWPTRINHYLLASGGVLT
jgi:uncharacterized protein (TIGR02594 family)